jgi:NADP-dependent 3-hydroxy acid dehydrogenase YdfG
LKETAAKIEEASKSSTVVHVADVTDADSLKNAATAIGKWNVLVLSSGFCPTPGQVASSDADDWWKGFEVCRSPSSAVS